MVAKMTYARARLWLGISGVGTMVVASTVMLFTQVPHQLFPDTETWQALDVLSLIAFVLGALVLMLPFDLLGGYLLPRGFRRSNTGFGCFAKRWAFGVAIQSSLFVLSGLAILAGGRLAGVGGAVAVIFAAAIGYLMIQGALTRLLTAGEWNFDVERLDTVMKQIAHCGLAWKRFAVVDHSDPGFTGGVVGLPRLETIILPRQWFNVLSKDQLAAMVARRVVAVNSGSRTRGLLVALTWILSGFVLVSLLPGAGVCSVAQLVTTCCGFTCWSFLGLLVLPTISRRASYAIDREVVEHGIPESVLCNVVVALDRLQDDEPRRTALVETIFHPVPSADNRQSFSGNDSLGAWHAARMTLFLSWSCLGLLSRAVHCNAGRPELWAMLPTD